MIVKMIFCHEVFAATCRLNFLPVSDKDEKCWAVGNGVVEQVRLVNWVNLKIDWVGLENLDLVILCYL